MSVPNARLSKKVEATLRGEALRYDGQTGMTKMKANVSFLAGVQAA